MGNLRSVQKALERVGAQVSVTDEAASVRKASKLVVPGVGAFDRAVRELKGRGLWEPVLEGIQSGKPFLGICLGFQLLFERSEEGSGEAGLGVFKGRVRRFDFPRVAGPSASTGLSGGRRETALKVPHMGWNEVLVVQETCPLLKQVPDKSYFYFVHSYYASCDERERVSAETEYGSRFTSMVWRDQVFGTQFHPEKSQTIGLEVLKNFVGL